MKLMHPFKLLIGNQKCDYADEDAAHDGDMIPMWRPCFAGDDDNKRALDHSPEMMFWTVVKKISFKAIFIFNSSGHFVHLFSAAEPFVQFC